MEVSEGFTLIGEDREQFGRKEWIVEAEGRERGEKQHVQGGRRAEDVLARIVDEPPSGREVLGVPQRDESIFIRHVRECHEPEPRGHGRGADERQFEQAG